MRFTLCRREFQAIVANVAPVLAEASSVLANNTGILASLEAALREGDEAITIFSSRSWLGRFLRAGRDLSDFEDISRRITTLVSQLAAAASLQSSAALASMQTTLSTGALSLAPLRAAVSAAIEAAGGLEAVRGDDSKLRSAEAALGAELRAVSAKVQLAEAGLAREAKELEEKVRAGVAGLRGRVMAELVEEQGVLRIRELPPRLRDLWGDEGIGCRDLEAPYEELADVAPVCRAAVQGMETLEEWVARVGGALEELVSGELKRAFTRRSKDGTMATVADLNGLCRRAAMRLRLAHDDVDLIALARLLSPGLKDPRAPAPMAATFSKVSGKRGTLTDADSPFDLSEDVAARLEGYLEVTLPLSTLDAAGRFPRRLCGFDGAYSLAPRLRVTGGPGFSSGDTHMDLGQGAGVGGEPRLPEALPPPLTPRHGQGEHRGCPRAAFLRRFSTTGMPLWLLVTVGLYRRYSSLRVPIDRVELVDVVPEKGWEEAVRAVESDITSRPWAADSDRSPRCPRALHSIAAPRRPFYQGEWRGLTGH